MKLFGLYNLLSTLPRSKYLAVDVRHSLSRQLVLVSTIQASYNNGDDDDEDDE